MDNPDDKLLPTDPADVAWTLRHTLLFDGCKAFGSARDVMAGITANYLLKALKQSGYVIMKRPVKEPLNHWPTAPRGE